MKNIRVVLVGEYADIAAAAEVVGDHLCYNTATAIAVRSGKMVMVSTDTIEFEYECATPAVAVLVIERLLLDHAHRFYGTVRDADGKTVAFMTPPDDDTPDSTQVI